MAYPTLWTRRLAGPLLGLAAALAATGCSSASTHFGRFTASDRPALTQVQAREVFDAYVATSAKAARTGDGPLALSVVTGVQRAVLSAALGSGFVISSWGTPSSSAYSSSLTIAPTLTPDSYGTPAFFLPERSGYPRFFVAAVTETADGTSPRGASGAAGGSPTTVLGGVKVPADGTALLLFQQASASTPWLLGGVSRLAAAATLPKLDTDSAGYTPVVRPSTATLLAPPNEVGALQAAVVDDGPSSAATRAVAGGPLTTGMYEGARDNADGLRAPRGDVYQWALAGTTLPTFALRTADGGALVFYAMSLGTTVAVPDVINKADPVRPGPPIGVPLALLPLLPPGQPAPQVQLQAEQTLSFAAIDPPPAKGKVQVIAIGGGLTAATAS